MPALNNGTALQSVNDSFDFFNTFREFAFSGVLGSDDTGVNMTVKVFGSHDDDALGKVELATLTLNGASGADGFSATSAKWPRLHVLVTAVSGTVNTGALFFQTR